MAQLALDDRKLRLQRKPRLGGFLRNIVDGRKSYSNLELRALAADQGIVEEDADLRSINSVMLSFKNAGLIEREGDKWVPRSKK